MLPFPHSYLRKKNKAFTLVELLIAVSIFSVVSIAVYSVFNSGASVMRRIKNIDLRQQKILLKSQRIIRELREQPACRKQLFSGIKSKISFAANTDYFPSRITYYFDNSSGSLMRVSDKLDEIITEVGKIDPEFKSKPKIFLSNVKEVKFEFLYLDLAKNAYVWTDEWAKDFLPLAVKFTITSENQENAATVFLPTA